MGQHGNHPIHQIYAGATFQSFPIQGGVLLHIIGHISNVNTQQEILPFPGKAYRIIQIFGIFPINGYHHHIPQILTAQHIRFGHFQLNPIGLLHHLLAKFHRNIESLYYRKDIHARVIHMA